MKIRMLVEMSGARNGRAWPKRGQVADLPTGEARHLVDAGIAEEAADVPGSVEKATVPPAEAAPPARAEAATPPEPEKRRPGRPRKPRPGE